MSVTIEQLERMVLDRRKALRTAERALTEARGSRQPVNTRRREIDSELGRLVFWGSECHGCGNATVGSMVCDNCGTMEHTKALWTEPQPEHR